MARLDSANLARARETIALYPHPRSALVPLCHIAQEQDGWLTPEAVEHIAELLGLTPAEVEGTASFYDMLHTEPVGRYLVGICTNIACLLAGGYELLEHAEDSLGTPVGGTTPDGTVTLEEVECIAYCDRAPCAIVNYRFFGPLTGADFDRLIADARAGRLAEDVPAHGTLNRVRRDGGLRVPADEVATQRAASDQARSERAAARPAGGAA
ncbi:MAG TPA: NAD(P)H-dependent oxidoreductase subunit E [Acidimicrobiales bacterium]|nr:NAD(P)H-dependent oxidoreductase subunit E [Acidimicrobiales bacterium]